MRKFLLVILFLSMACNIPRPSALLLPDKTVVAETPTLETELAEEGKSAEDVTPESTKHVTATAVAKTTPKAKPTATGKATPKATSDQPAKDGSEFTGTVGLENFDSYRLKFNLEFDGLNGSKPAKGQVEGSLEATTDPPAKHLAMQMDGATVAELAGQTNAIEFYEVNGATYIKNPLDGSWISFPSRTDNPLTKGFFAPEDIISLPKTAQRSGEPETVNGVSAYRYSFTEKELAETKYTYSGLNGKVWVAVEGDYVVKYEAAGQAKASPTDDDKMFETASVKIAYDLLETNSNLTIAPPQQDGGNFDLPKLEDASGVFSASGMTSYKTETKLAGVIDFYRKTLTAQGWQEDDALSYLTDTNTMLSFKKDGTTLTITATSDGKQTNVILLSQKE